jgi:hypothetical protein
MSEQQPYADPADLQFGRAARDKAERADRLAKDTDVEQLEEGSSEEVEPRPGNKAPPAS